MGPCCRSWRQLVLAMALLLVVDAAMVTSTQSCGDMKCRNHGRVDVNTCNCICPEGFGGKYCQANVIVVGPETIGKVPLKARPKVKNDEFHFSTKRMIVIGRLPPTSYEKTLVYNQDLKRDDKVVQHSISFPVFKIGDSVKYTLDKVLLDDYKGRTVSGVVKAIGVAKNSKIRMEAGEPPWIRVLIVEPQNNARSHENRWGIKTGKVELEAITEQRARKGPMSWEDSWAAVKWFHHDTSVKACEGVVYPESENRNTTCPLGCSKNGICDTPTGKCFCFSLWEGCGCERGSKRLLMEIILGVVNNYGENNNFTTDAFGNFTDLNMTWGSTLDQIGAMDPSQLGSGSVNSKVWEDWMGVQRYGSDYNNPGTWPYLIGMVEHMKSLLRQQEQHDIERLQLGITAGDNMMATLKVMQGIVDKTFDAPDLLSLGPMSDVSTDMQSLEKELQKDINS